MPSLQLSLGLPLPLRPCSTHWSMFAPNVSFLSSILQHAFSGLTITIRRWTEILMWGIQPNYKLYNITLLKLKQLYTKLIYWLWALEQLDAGPWRPAVTTGSRFQKLSANINKPVIFLVSWHFIYKIKYTCLTINPVTCVAMKNLKSVITFWRVWQEWNSMKVTAMK